MSLIPGTHSSIVHFEHPSQLCTIKVIHVYWATLMMMMMMMMMMMIKMPVIYFHLQNQLLFSFKSLLLAKTWSNPKINWLVFKYLNSCLTPRLRGIKQYKWYWDSGMNNSFFLFYSLISILIIIINNYCKLALYYFNITLHNNFIAIDLT